MRLIKKILVIIKPVLLAMLISCGSDLYDAANRDNSVNDPVVPPKTQEPIDIYTNATLNDIKAQEDKMSTGDSVDLGSGISSSDIIISLSDAYIPVPANTLVFFYETVSGNYGKMIITNELVHDDVLYPSYSCPPLMISYVTYNTSGNVIASGIDQQVEQGRCGDLDMYPLQKDAGTDGIDFQWLIDDNNSRGLQSYNSAKFYRIK